MREGATTRHITRGVRLSHGAHYRKNAGVVRQRIDKGKQKYRSAIMTNIKERKIEMMNRVGMHVLSFAEFLQLFGMTAISCLHHCSHVIAALVYFEISVFYHSLGLLHARGLLLVVLCSLTSPRRR